MPQDKGHDDVFLEVHIPLVQPTDNIQDSGFKIPDISISSIKSIDNEKPIEISSVVINAPLIKPEDNEQEQQVKVPVIFADTVKGTDNEKENELKVQVVIIPDVKPIDNEKENNLTFPVVDLEETRSNVEDEKDIDIRVNIISSNPIKPIDNDPHKHKIIPLSGKLITSEDPVTIGQNFRTYKNLRPTSTHPKAIGGMAVVGTLDATYMKGRSAYHLSKNQPAESHVLVQAWNTAKTASQVLDNKTAIGSAGNFEATEVWTDTGTVEY
ncbi:MAG: hypothetical protein V1709_03880, partial [Planctomycetota bacterium]